MRSHVTFRTTRFNQTEVQPHFINPCCFGEDCIAWLITELRARGWPDITDAWQEDWGWQRTAPDIRDVRWHFEDLFMRGRSSGASHPSEPRSAGEVVT